MNVKISGMVCGSCVKTVKEKLAKIPEAQDVVVSLKNNSATILPVKGKTVDLEKIKAALEGSNFKVVEG